MKAFVAFLRGVSPMNLKMPALKAALELAGFANVKTVLSSGNVVFAARSASEASIERKLEAAMTGHLGKSFFTLVRPTEVLEAILDAKPHERFHAQAGAKRVVTFLREKPQRPVQLPIERDGTRILAVEGREVYSDYVSTPAGPVFMRMLEQTFGKDITTRTWDTLGKVVAASRSAQLK